MDQPRSHFLAFILRLVLSSAVLWISVRWVAGENPRNTFLRALLISLVLSAAYYVTMVRFLWFLVVPWLLYVLIWLAVIMGGYDLSFPRALLLALALTFLSWLVTAIFGIRTLRS